MPPGTLKWGGKNSPVNPTFLRQVAHRFFFFLASLSPSLSSHPASDATDAAAAAAAATAAAAMFSAALTACCTACVWFEHSSAACGKKNEKKMRGANSNLDNPPAVPRRRRLRKRRYWRSRRRRHLCRGRRRGRPTEISCSPYCPDCSRAMMRMAFVFCDQMMTYKCRLWILRWNVTADISSGAVSIANVLNNETKWILMKSWPEFEADTLIALFFF